MPFDTGLIVAVQLVLALAVSLEVFVDIFYEVSANPRRSAHTTCAAFECSALRRSCKALNSEIGHKKHKNVDFLVSVLVDTTRKTVCKFLL